MDLIPIQQNLLVNADKISAIKMQLDSEGKETVIVTVDNKNYFLEIPLDRFLRRLKESGVNPNEQFWAV